MIATVGELSAAEGYRDEHALTFTYRLEIAEVLFDTAGDLSAGDSVTMISGEGAMPLSELKPKLDYTGSVYIPKYQGDAPEDSWLLATNHGTTPIEVGREYLLFLEKNADSDSYIEYGHRFLWEVMDGRLVCSDGLAKWYDDEYTMEAVRDVIAARTGRCDAIGETAYADEVNRREAAELAAMQVELLGKMAEAAADRTGEAVPEKERRIVYTVPGERYAGETLAERAADAQAAVIVRLTERTDARINSLTDASFFYNAVIEEIVFDAGGECLTGDAVSVVTGSALVEPWILQEEAVLHSRELLEDGILGEGYHDGDFVNLSSPGSIPTEAGKWYLMLIKKPALAGIADYYECGGQFLYEYRDGKLYTGDGKTSKKAKISLKDIQKAMEGGLTG